MNADNNYASDSDQSDEDYCPEEDAARAEGSDPASEEDSEDAEISDDDAENDKAKKAGTKRVAKTTTTSAKKTKSDEVKVEVSRQENGHRRSRRQAEAASNGKSRSQILEKDELESDEEEKSKTKCLWADFMSKVKKDETSGNAAHNNNSNNNDKSSSADSERTPNKTQGKAAGITKPHVALATGKSNASPAPLKRPAFGGMTSVLSGIGKKSKKPSVLESSQQDWLSFKKDEGIEEELRTHNKGRNGYLERQDFLQRTDLRQFEIEKSLRQSRRSK